MKIVIIFAFAFMISQIALAGGSRTAKCGRVAREVIAITNAQIQIQPNPKTGGYNIYSNPWEDSYSQQSTDVCCVSYDAEPPLFGACSSYTRDICVDIWAMKIVSDTHEEGPWCGY